MQFTIFSLHFLHSDGCGLDLPIGGKIYFAQAIKNLDREDVVPSNVVECCPSAVDSHR